MAPSPTGTMVVELGTCKYKVIPLPLPAPPPPPPTPGGP